MGLSYEHFVLCRMGQPISAATALEIASVLFPAGQHDRLQARYTTHHDPLNAPTFPFGHFADEVAGIGRHNFKITISSDPRAAAGEMITALFEPASFYPGLDVDESTFLELVICNRAQPMLPAHRAHARNGAEPDEVDDGMFYGFMDGSLPAPYTVHYEDARTGVPLTKNLNPSYVIFAWQFTGSQIPALDNGYVRHTLTARHAEIISKYFPHYEEHYSWS